MFEPVNTTEMQQDTVSQERRMLQYLGNRYGQKQDTRDRYAEAISDCSRIEYLEMTVSEIARMHDLHPESLRNQLRRHYPDVIPQRDAIRQSMGLNKLPVRGLSQRTAMKYAPAIKKLRNTDLTVKEVAKACNVSTYGLQQHLLYYHKDLAEQRLMVRLKALDAPRRRGAKDATNRTVGPRSEAEERYAEAISLYRTTDQTAADIAIACNLDPGSLLNFVHRWYPNDVELREKVRREKAEARRRQREQRQSQSPSVKAERKYMPALTLIEAGDTYDEAARKIGVPSDRLAWWVRHHRPDLHVKARSNAWVTLPSGTRIMRSGWPKYLEAAKAYCETDEPIKHMARRLGLPPTSLGNFLRANYPDFRQKRQQEAADRKTRNALLTTCISLLMCLSAALSAYGQQVSIVSDTLNIRFRLDSVKIDMGFADNAARWQTFEDHFRQHYENSSTPIQLDIYAGASPEGTAAHNRWLGEHRGQAVRRLIRERLGNQVTNIFVHNEAARWEGFRKLVAASSEPWRDEVLRIIDQPPTTEQHMIDHRERQLRALHDGTVWPVLLDRYLAPLRSGATAVVSWTVECDTVFVRDTVFVPVQTGPADGMTGRRDGGRLTAVLCWRPYLSLKTNLLSDALLTPNLEVEVPLGWSRFSFMAEWWTPWYRWHGPNKHNRCYELLALGGELRYWLSRREADCPRLLRGHFLGLYGGGGKYDIQPGGNDHEGWQGEYTSLGLTYGYSWFVQKHWRIECSLSAGFVGGPQRYYHGMFDDTHLIWQRNQRLSYVGPTKLKLSVAYLLGRRTLRKGGGL